MTEPEELSAIEQAAAEKAAAEQEGISRRKLPRRQLAVDVKVTNAQTGEDAGTLVNVTVEGIMLVNETFLATDSLYQMTLTLPHDILGSNVIQLGVDCLWYNPTGQSDLYWSGCQIIDVSDDDLDRLQALIDEMGL